MTNSHTNFALYANFSLRMCEIVFIDKLISKIMFFYGTTIIEEFVCPPNMSETVAVRTMKLAHRPHNYCLDNDKSHFKTNFTVHFINHIKNNSANRRWHPKHRPAKHAWGRALVLPSGRSICITFI